MILISLICLFITFVLSSTYDAQKKQTFNQQYIAPSDSDDTLVRVSNTVAL